MARKFLVDLAPKLVWASSPVIDVFIRSGVSRYLEFRSIQHCYLYLDDALQQVRYPVSCLLFLRNSFRFPHHDQISSKQRRFR